MAEEAVIQAAREKRAAKTKLGFLLKPAYRTAHDGQVSNSNRHYCPNVRGKGSKVLNTVSDEVPAMMTRYQQRLIEIEHHMHEKLKADTEAAMRALSDAELLSLIAALDADLEGREIEPQDATPGQLALIEAWQRVAEFEAENGR